MEELRPGTGTQEKSGAGNPASGLPVPEAFELVADERAHDEDDHEDHDLDDKANDPKGTKTKARACRGEEDRDQHENDTGNDPGDRRVLKNTRIVFLPLVKKTKDDTNQEIQ
jgi:hypothetical protein